jgi:hypothetical protein
VKKLRKCLLLALLFVAAALAQKPAIKNAKLQELSAAGGLKAAVDSVVQKQSGPAWIGYRIPAVAKERTMCCFGSSDGWRSGSGAGQCCLGCRMDSDHGSSFTGTVSDCTPPEPVPYAFVFLKAENKQIRKVRVFSADCPLDFTNLPLYWLEDVKPEQSIDLLAGIVTGESGSTSDRDDEGRGAGHQAIMAIALHDAPAADAALEKLIQPGRPARLRENVAFWLAVERGKSGFQVLHKYVKNDSDDRFREKGTFALSQSKEPEALQDLITMARSDSSSRVRGQAIFWLAQKGGHKAAQQITDAIENDPETAVKKKAVFALTQMHDGNSVSMLINVAKTNRNPAVRKEAIFWLGQSNDPRALDYLEEILTK